MKIKHYDSDLQEWIIDGASRADDLELSNPAYLDDEGRSISVDQGFTKIANKLKKVEDNLAWIYVNGAHGGGGTGPGTGIDEITIEVLEGNTIYTSTNTARFNIIIKSGTVSKSFTIVIKDVRTGKVLTTLRKYSLTRIPIELTELEGNVELEITAYDSMFNYSVPAYVSVIYGAISLSLQTEPSKTITRGGTIAIPANFTIRNNVLGATSSFTLKANGKLIDEVTGINVSPRSLVYNLRDIILGGEVFPSVYTGEKFYFEAQASTILNGIEIKSNIIRFDITVVEADSLVIVTNNISESVSEDLTEFPQGSQLNFTYYLSYAPNKYTTFNVDYKVYLMKGGNKVSEIPLMSGRIPNVNKSNNNIFSISTVDLDINSPEEYLMVELFASAVSDPGDTSAQFTKEVYARIIEAEKVDLYANNDLHTLLAYYSRVTGFPASSEKVWTYNLNKTGRFPYNDIFFNQFPNGVKLYLNKTNGFSSGFLNNTDRINNIPGIVLNGEAYANIAVAKQMFPNYTIGEFGFFQPKGFNISLTYKAEEMTDTSRVVMSIGRYKNNLLDSGIEVTLEDITVKIGTADTLNVKLPQNELLTVDIDVSLLGNIGWYFKIYVNGVLSAVTKVDQSSIDWTFEQDLYFGCRNNNGVLSRFSNITIYDIKLYTSSQSEYAIVQNYISATEQASLIRGQVDESLDAELRDKNLFDSAGDCLIWDKAKNSFYEGEQLYNILSAQMEVNTPYPIVMVREASNSPTDFKAYSTAIFSAEEKHEIMGKTFPCEITFKNKLGDALIKTPEGVSAENGVRIGLQGTSSLSYNAKNFELYMGNMNEIGKPQLFQPIDSWLPENEFTLKADVMDSAHVNNVVIGKIVNGEVTNDAGVPVKPLTATPPMLLPESVFASPEMAQEVRSKIKHTSDGFPCLVFVDFAPDRVTGMRETRFMGIYNFNLGRFAHFNLGLKILTNYSKVNPGGMPTLIEDYSELQTYWNTSQDAGVYSMEVNQNHSEQGAFQQDDMQIVRFMIDSIYTSQDVDRSYDAVKTFYTQMANMALSQTPKYTMDDAGQTPTKLIPGEYYNYNAAYYNFDTLDTKMNWNNANAYFILALLFGMVDSMCKNLTLRSWGGKVWYTAFYDMDTAFGLNNAGQDIVEYWAHLHRWYNIQAGDTGITTFTLEKNYTNQNAEGIKQFFACNWSRLWEVLENLPIRDSGGLSVDRTSLEKMYANLRLNLFPDPDAFIDKYYKGYTEQTGSIMFNYDYKVKYLKIAQTYNEVDGYVDSTDFSQLKFLHGNRVIHVKDWFKKRVLFLDGVYGVAGNRSLLDPSIDSPSNQMWSNNKSAGTGAQILFDITMSASSKILYRWSYDKTNGSFWLDDKDIPAVVPTPGGETIIYMYANKYITKFDNFKAYPWTLIPNIDFPLLKELDLSDSKNIPSDNFLFPKVYDPVSGKGLKNIEKLILRNVQLSNSTSYALDVRDCLHLSHLDISNSNITSVLLSNSAVLKYYNLANTAIKTLVINNQSFLETLVLEGCDELTEIVINNCNSLQNLNLPKNVRSVKITNCELLSALNIPYNSLNNSISNLQEINIDNCPGLKSFNIQGQNNPTLNVNLVGAWNLEFLNLSRTNTTNILLPSLKVEGEDYFNTLRSLNISNTNITDFVYNDNPKDLEGRFIRKEYLDLLNFPDLDSILASNNSYLKEVRCINNTNNPIDLNTQSFYNCSSLNRIIGHYNIRGTEVFKGCGALKLNAEDVYQNKLPHEFLLGEDVTNISINTNTLRGCFENCSTLSYNDFKRIVAQFNNDIISLEATFKGCSNITGEIWRDLFTNARNVDTIKETFAGSGLSGTLVSRSDNYSSSDESTWGFLDYLPNLKDLEAAFEGSLLEWIDNNLFQPKGNTYYTFLNIDKMFKNCGRLKTCADTRQVTKTYGRLNSKTFFTALRSLIATYPKNVFSGCTAVDMDVVSSGNDTFLFHSLKEVSHNILDGSLYDGVNLFGEIKVNVFGGISNTIVDDEVYYIPKFTSLQYPFPSSSNLSVNISEMGQIFRNIGSTLLQAIGVFSGMKTIGSTKIPNDIFQGCSVLNSIDYLFANLDITNDGEVYEFPNNTLFKDTKSLKSIKGLFNNTNKIRIKLIGEGFKNCKLEDVSVAFASSGVFGVIPYRLFFMVENNNIVQTIKNMEGVFNHCWLLGYTHDREISEDTLLETITYSGSDPIKIYTRWSDNIVKTPGTKVDYKLDVTNMSKSYNYDRDERTTIPNPDYIKDEANRPSDYDPDTPEVIDNPDYNPGEQAFDIWYLDGYGWEGATSDDLAELILQKTRLQRYFKYDEYQKQSILDQASTDWYIDTHQNYMMPTDLFRYCHSECTLVNVLSDLSWKERIVEVNSATGKGTIVETKNIQGLRGRIPVKLFQSLKNNQEFKAVFKNTKFDPFYGLRGTNTNTLQRGLMYPIDLLKYNQELLEVPELFADTNIPVGVDINSDLFSRNLKLRNISSCWANCTFDNRPYKIESLPTDPVFYPQIDFVNIFKSNIRITNASNLFAVTDIKKGNKGLLMISPELLRTALNINNISGMFYYNSEMRGAVPLFQSSIYTALNAVTGYLAGVPKNNITNANQLESRLIPTGWG